MTMRHSRNGATYHLQFLTLFQTKSKYLTLRLSFLANTSSNLLFDENMKQGFEIPDIWENDFFEMVALMKILAEDEMLKKSMSFLKEQKTGHIPMHLCQFRNF